MGLRQGFRVLRGDAQDHGLIGARFQGMAAELLAVVAAARVLDALQEVNDGMGVPGVKVLGHQAAVVRGEVVGGGLLQVAEGFGFVPHAYLHPSASSGWPERKVEGHTERASEPNPGRSP